MLAMRLEEASRWRSRGNCCWNMLEREEVSLGSLVHLGSRGREFLASWREESEGERGERSWSSLWGAGVRERWGEEDRQGEVELGGEAPAEGGFQRGRGGRGW